MELVFKNYCIISLGNTYGIIDIVRKIAEGGVRKLEQKGVLICTFSSVMTLSEIKGSINMDDKTYFIFEINDETSTYNIGRKDIQDKLFGGIVDKVEEYTNKLNTTLDSDTGGKLTDKINNLTKKEVSDEIDKLLDKGLDNLSSEEVKKLDLLSKKG